MENIIIIGGGPAGLAASIYNARASLNPLVLAGSPPGGQLTLTSEVENYPGYEAILGPELISKFRNHATKFGVRFVDENVTKVDFSKKPFTLITGSGKSFQSRSVLITTGAKALWLNLPSEQKLRGKGVSACATCDGFFFKNKTVAVVGGGDTALEEVLTLTKFASKVYAIHRRDSFRASKIMQERVLSNPKVEVLWNSAIEEVVGENKVEGIRVKKIASLSHGSIVNNATMQQSSNDVLKLDGLFVAIGHKPDTDIFKGQIDLDEKGYVMTHQRVAEDYIFSQRVIDKARLESLKAGHYNFATSVKGVFAAGDCVDHLYRQAATAVGQGVAASLEVERWLGVPDASY